jgi:hypothetical protein
MERSMNNSIETEIIKYEAKLRQAMLWSDVKAADDSVA